MIYIYVCMYDTSMIPIQNRLTYIHPTTKKQIFAYIWPPLYKKSDQFLSLQHFFSAVK